MFFGGTFYLRVNINPLPFKSFGILLPTNIVPVFGLLHLVLTGRTILWKLPVKTIGLHRRLIACANGAT